MFELDNALQLAQFPSSGVHGLTLWDSGLVLAKTLEIMIEEQRWNYGPRVIEIGAGLALPSLTLARANMLKPFQSDLEILVTDNRKEVLDVALDNILKNDLSSHNVSVKSLDFMTSLTEDFGQFDLIIFSDLLYDEKLYEPLVQILDRLSHSKTKLLFANEKRDFGKEMDFYRKLGSVFSFRPVKELHPLYQSEDIYIFEAWKK